MRNRAIRFGVFGLLALALVFSGFSAPTSRAQGAKLGIWTKYNAAAPQTPADRWMAALIQGYAGQTGIGLDHVTQPADQINTKVIEAAKAKVVPDVAYIDSQWLGTYIKNNALTDLTDFVRGAKWVTDIDPGALAACTAPDGKIYCVPTSTASFFIAYWNQLFPSGYPFTTDDLLKTAEDLKKTGKYAITFKGGETASVEDFYASLISTFGGKLADASGKASWASPESAKAVDFVRTLVQKGYTPKAALGAGLDWQTSFKTSETASIVTGTFSYMSLLPLTSPSGQKYEMPVPATGFDTNALAMGAAYDKAELAFAAPLTAPGGKPTSVVLATAWAIPAGAKNVDGAKGFITYEIDTKRNIEFAVANGALPAMTSAINDPMFATAYWQSAAKYQSESGISAPSWADYNLALKLLSTAIVNCANDPGRDIAAELQKAQDEYNNTVK